MKYKDLYNEWRSDPEQFWMHAAKNINWVKFPTFALDDTKKPFYRWFPDGEDMQTLFHQVGLRLGFLF